MRKRGKGCYREIFLASRREVPVKQEFWCLQGKVCGATPRAVH